MGAVVLVTVAVALSGSGGALVNPGGVELPSLPRASCVQFYVSLPKKREICATS